MVFWRHLIPPPLLLLTLSLLLTSTVVLADEQAGFNCHITVDGAQFDLSTLTKDHVVNRTRELPPTKMIESLRFNLCSALKVVDDIAENEQCPVGSTFACLTTVNEKQGESDRVVSVVQVAKASAPESVTASLIDKKSVSLLFKGADYPHPSNSSNVPQSWNVTIICDPNATSDPKSFSYDGSLLSLEWSAPQGCPQKQDTEPPNNDSPDKGGDGSNDEQDVGSGVGWFFLVLLLAFAAYFGFGAYYNYTTYGARGRDLIPHRDFWQEVPYMLKDVVSHLCSSVNPRRSSRGGYVAV